MRPAGQILVAAAARLYAPVLAVFALVVLIGKPAGAGFGFVAGLLFALGPLLHALAFGAEAARRAFPPYLARVLMVVGLLVALASLTSASGAFGDMLGEAGVFLATASAALIVSTVLIGRAPTLLDADW